MNWQSFFRFSFGGDNGDRSLRYHFIHIPKNGGTSVRKFLQKNPQISFTNPYHYRYIDIADEVGRNLEFFSVIRNPWSRTASRYTFALKDSRSWDEDDPRRRYIQSASFEQYVKEHRIFEVPGHPGKPWMGPMNSWLNQLEWLVDEDGIVQCKCLRLEHINHDMSAYFNRKLKLPRKNVSAGKEDYRGMYTDELIEIVADMFKEDIEYFGFSFDTPATRNIAVQ